MMLTGETALHPTNGASGGQCTEPGEPWVCIWAPPLTWKDERDLKMCLWAARSCWNITFLTCGHDWWGCLQVPREVCRYTGWGSRCLANVRCVMVVVTHCLAVSYVPFVEGSLLKVNPEFVEIRALKTPRIFGMEAFQIQHLPWFEAPFS